MKSILCEKLNFKLQPVAIFYTDIKPENALQFEKGKRGCVASMLTASSKKGITAVFDEETYGCAGGGVGLCFGDAFTKNDHPTTALLSTGDEALAQMSRSYFRSLGRGERFFQTPELVQKWKDDVPYTETDRKYVVFKPLGTVAEDEEPDLVCIFANPDQLSALVILSGYKRGKALNVKAPFGAACHSILLAYQETKKDEPDAIMGFFDISQRGNIPKELLTLTMPYKMFCEIESGADDGCLTTEAWGKIADRFE